MIKSNLKHMGCEEASRTRLCSMARCEILWTRRDEISFLGGMIYRTLSHSKVMSVVKTLWAGIHFWI